MAPPKPTGNNTCDRHESCPHESAIIELRSQVEQVGRDVAETKGDMRIVKNALTGNLETGKPGLVDRVSTLESHARADRKSKDRWRNVAFGGIGAFVAAAGAWLWHTLTGKSG